MTIRVVIADGHEVVRTGIKAVLSSEIDMEVVGEAATGAEVVQQTKDLCPDVLVLDIRMPGNDPETLGRLRSECESTHLLVFSSYDNPANVAKAADLGANGYLLKTAKNREILEAIRRVAAGESIWTRQELRRVTGATAAPRHSVDLEVPLTRRETEVLRQLTLGHTNKEIAQALGISYETVKEHVQHILRKVGVADRTQAAVWAVRKGLV